MPPASLTAAFTGVVAAPLTPFTHDGELDPEGVTRYVEFLLGHGVTALMVGGTTGEFIAMTAAERLTMIAAFVKAVDGAVPVIAHVADVHVRQAKRIATRAADVGADALTAITPYYHRASPAAVETAMRELAQAVPHLPFLVYNYPDAAGNPLPYSTFERLLDEPNLAGVKLSVGSLDEIEPYVGVMDRVCVLSGNDVLLPAVVERGGKAIVSGNAAAFPDVVSSLLSGLTGGDEVTAGRAPGQLASLAIATRNGSPDRLRDLLRRRGLDLGSSRIRTFVSADIDSVDDRQRFDELCSAAAER